MALNNAAKVDITEHTCDNCNTTVFRWIDMITGEEFWADEYASPTCGRSSSFHLVSET